MKKSKKKIKKSGLELAFEDIEKGHVHRLITPINKKSRQYFTIDSFSDEY